MAITNAKIFSSEASSSLYGAYSRRRIEGVCEQSEVGVPPYVLYCTVLFFTVWRGFCYWASPLTEMRGDEMGRDGKGWMGWDGMGWARGREGQDRTGQDRAGKVKGKEETKKRPFEAASSSWG